MDAAVAAAMSDPERNPNFRRRWADEAGVTSIPLVVPPAEIGSFGLVLRDALEGRRLAAGKEARATAAEDHPR